MKKTTPKTLTVAEAIAMMKSGETVETDAQRSKRIRREEARRIAAPKPAAAPVEAPSQAQIEYARGIARRSGMSLDAAIRSHFGSRINPTRAQISTLIDALKTHSHEED